MYVNMDVGNFAMRKLKEESLAAEGQEAKEFGGPQLPGSVDNI